MGGKVLNRMVWDRLEVMLENDPREPVSRPFHIDGVTGTFTVAQAGYSAAGH